MTTRSSEERDRYQTEFYAGYWLHMYIRSQKEQKGHAQVTQKLVTAGSNYPSTAGGTKSERQYYWSTVQEHQKVLGSQTWDSGVGVPRGWCCDLWENTNRPMIERTIREPNRVSAQMIEGGFQR